MVEDRAGQVEQQPAQNTDRELWREGPGDYYAPRLFVTEGGGIGMSVGGFVIVKPLTEWHALAQLSAAPPPPKVTDAMVEAAYLAYGGLPNGMYGRDGMKVILEAAWRAASSGDA